MSWKERGGSRQVESESRSEGTGTSSLSLAQKQLGSPLCQASKLLSLQLSPPAPPGGSEIGGPQLSPHSSPFSPQAP